MSRAHIYQAAAPVSEENGRDLWSPDLHHQHRPLEMRFSGAPAPLIREAGKGAGRLCPTHRSRGFCCELQFQTHYSGGLLCFSSLKMPWWYNYFAIYSSEFAHLTSTQPARYKRFTNVSSFTPHACPGIEALLLSPFYRRQKADRERSKLTRPHSCKRQSWDSKQHPCAPMKCLPANVGRVCRWAMFLSGCIWNTAIVFPGV